MVSVAPNIYTNGSKNINHIIARAVPKNIAVKKPVARTFDEYSLFFCPRILDI